MSRFCQLIRVTCYIIEITLKLLEIRGYLPAAKKERFLVKGSYGPVREGDLERAKSWGAELAKAIK